MIVGDSRTSNLVWMSPWEDKEGTNRLLSSSNGQLEQCALDREAERRPGPTTRLAQDVIGGQDRELLPA